MLSAVLANHKPNVWEDTSYTINRYQLFQLGKGDEEYNIEITPFRNCDTRIAVKSLQRVQNPYQLGRFIIRKEQKQQRPEPVEVLKYYHPIHGADLKTALEFNMDVRRYLYKYPQNTVENKNPKFYTTPSAAANSFSHVSERCILICNVLGRRTNEPVPYEYKTNDTEYMPIYVVELY